MGCLLFRLEKVNKETHKQLYCQLLSRCSKELSSLQVKSLPDHLRAIIEPRFEAFQEKKRMCVVPYVVFLCVFIDSVTFLSVCDSFGNMHFLAENIKCNVFRWQKCQIFSSISCDKIFIMVLPNECQTDARIECYCQIRRVLQQNVKLSN